MNPLLKHLSVFLFTQLVITQTSLHAAEPRDTMSDTWAATDAPGRVLPMSAEVGAPWASFTSTGMPRLGTRRGMSFGRSWREPEAEAPLAEKAPSNTSSTKQLLPKITR